MFVFVLINKFIIYEPNYNESTSSAKLPCPFAGSILAVQLPSEPEGAVPSASASRRRRLSSRCFGRRRRIHGDHRGSVPAGAQGGGKARRRGRLQAALPRLRGCRVPRPRRLGSRRQGEAAARRGLRIPLHQRSAPQGRSFTQRIRCGMFSSRLLERGTIRDLVTSMKGICLMKYLPHFFFEK
jgi:hypothetical protein